MKKTKNDIQKESAKATEHKNGSNGTNATLAAKKVAQPVLAQKIEAKKEDKVEKKVQDKKTETIKT